jgi:pantoate--beta-alanine ligase
LVVQELIKRHFPKIELHIEPTVRQLDGLALSSRNTRLSETQQLEALSISKAMFFIQDHWGKESIDKLLQSAQEIIANQSSLAIEYFKICNKKSLQELEGNSNEMDEAVILAAVFCGEVRLIDNLIVHK